MILAWIFAFYVVRVVFCNIELLAPDTLAVFDANAVSPNKNTIPVLLKWVQNREPPFAGEIYKYTFVVCTGPNISIQPLTLPFDLSANEITDNQYTIEIPRDLGIDGLYYVQVKMEANNGYGIHYTNRFRLAGMKGSQQVQVVTYDEGPPLPEFVIQNNLNPHDIPYNLQTGSTIFAPKQIQPPTKVAATAWTQRYPKSSLTYFTDRKNSAIRMTTITPAAEYEKPRDVNWASPAPMPWENGKGYDAIKRLTQRARKVNKKRKL